MRFRTLLVALATAISLTLATAAPALAVDDVRISGKVTDSVTGAAIANVCVVNGPVALRCWTSSNADGNFVILMDFMPASGYTTNIQFLRSGYTTLSQNITVFPNQNYTMNAALVSTTPGVAAPIVAPPAVIGNPPPTTTTPLPVAPVAPAPTVSVEQRIADFWKRIDALAPTDNVSAGDLGGWALNVIERNPRARLTAADFRASTADMQAGLDRAGLGPVPAVPPTPVANIEQKIADFWTRIGALQPGDFVSAADLGQWALNVIGRIPRAQLSAADFRASTAGMQGGFDRAGLAP